MILLVGALASARADGGDVLAGLINSGIATWGYVEASKHKEVRVYCNITAVIFTIKALVNFANASN